MTLSLTPLGVPPTERWIIQQVLSIAGQKNLISWSHVNNAHTFCEVCAVLSPFWRRVSTDAGTLCIVLSPLWHWVSSDAGTLCIVLSTLWCYVCTDAGTVGADLPTPYPLCLVEWLEAWLDWSPLPVSLFCPELRLPALCPRRVLCSETLINIWVEPAIESVFFPDSSTVFNCCQFQVIVIFF